LVSAFNTGVLLWHQSVTWLGKSFIDGVTLPDEIIKKGPYLLTRNPIYLAYLIILGTFGGVLLISIDPAYRLIQVLAYFVEYYSYAL